MKCRICGSLTNVVYNIGDQVNTAKFPLHGTVLPKTPVILVKCVYCHLLQMQESLPQSEMYEEGYGYRSGISNTMRQHLQDYNSEIQSKIFLKPGDVVVDVGSNDATFLHYYDSSLKRIGIDPTGKQFSEYYGDLTLFPTYFVDGLVKNAKIISCISMFYDLPDPVQFARDIYNSLSDDGIWTIEQSYMPTMIERNSIDTICHEHLEYYALYQIRYICKQVGFVITDVSFNDCNGGSFRVYMKKSGEECSIVEKIIADEIKFGIQTAKYYTDFFENVNIQVERLKIFLQHIANEKQSTYIYGASTKGNCLLQYAGIDEKLCKYAVERNPQKIDKQTSTGIKIISEETMRENPPEYLLVLPWHFREEIIQREFKFLNEGGQLIFPFPTLEVYSRKPKMLITGIDGMIAKECVQQFTDYTIYGTRHDDKNFNNIENALHIVQPFVVLHLAFNSSSRSFNSNIDFSPLIMLEKICKYSLNNSCRVFNASSIEIYGVQDIITENSQHLGTSPYAIVKSACHKLVQYYRSLGCMVYNGIFSTIEGKNRDSRFLMGKIKNATTSNAVLESLSDYKNFLHVYDAVTAIRKIIKALPDDYLICNTLHYLVHDVVERFYNLHKISVGFISPTYKENISDNFTKVFISNQRKGTKVLSFPDKLSRLWWTPTKTIDDILMDK